MAITVLIAISSSGSTASTDAVLSSATTERTDLVESAPIHCASARKAVRFYQRRHHEWKLKTGVVTRQPAGLPHCPRNYAKFWRAKAYEARVGYQRWFNYHWAWWKWLPDKWARIGACETGYGKKPGQWTWNSGTYQGAFGFYRGTWDAYKPKGAPSEAYLATPRQQYQCALNVAAVHGYGAWGCGGA